MRWIQLLLALKIDKIKEWALDSLFMVTRLVGGRASVHLRSSDTLDHFFMNLPSIWFPNNLPDFFLQQTGGL